MKKVKLDSIDFIILNELQKDSSISNAKLSEIVGLSPSSTLLRTSNLKKKGILKGFKAEIGFHKLGLNKKYTCRVVVSENVDAFISLLLSEPAVINVVIHQHKTLVSDVKAFVFSVLDTPLDDCEKFLDILKSFKGIVDLEISTTPKLIKGDMYLFDVQKYDKLSIDL
jgi:DNA-binding Lrp family transcriptional regulator